MIGGAGRVLEIPHMSFSSWNSYTTCPRSYYLGKIRGAWARGGWFFQIGTVVHEAVESRLKGEDYDVKQNLYRLVREQMKTDPDVENWKHGTYQDEPAVKHNAVKLAQDCVDEAYRWLDEEFTSITMIEADISGSLPGCDVPIKGYVDVLGEHKKHGPVIGDWKSSAAKPKNNFQLETYQALLLTSGVDRYQTGMWMMLRPGASRARPVDLSKVDPARVGAEYQKVLDKIRRGVFPTDAGWACNTCVQDVNCALKSKDKERSAYYDDVASNHSPF